MQLERTMRLMAVKINRDASDRDVRHDQRINNDLPDARAGQAIGQEIENCIKDSVQNSTTPRLENVRRLRWGSASAYRNLGLNCTRFTRQHPRMAARPLLLLAA